MTFDKLVKIVTEKTTQPPPMASETILVDCLRFLLKDEFFSKQFYKISDKFKGSIGDYSKIPGFTTYSKGVKNLSRLEKTRDNYESKLEALQDELLENNRIINRNNLSPSEKNDMEMNIAVLDKKIQVLKSQKRREKNKSRKLEYDDKIQQLEASKTAKTEKYKHAMLPKFQIERIKASIFDITKRIKTQTDRLVKINDKIGGVLSKINNLSAINLEADKAAVESVVDLIKFTSTKLLRDYETSSSHTIDSDILTSLNALSNDESNILSDYIATNSNIDPISSINPSELTFMKIKSMLNDAKSRKAPTSKKMTRSIADDSFDKFTEGVLKSTVHDADDFKLDIMEMLSLIKYPK